MKENPEKVKGRKQDRAVKGQPDYGCVPSFFWYRFFGSGIVINLARLVFGMKIKTDKRIKNMEGPLVIVGNHPSYIDPIIMGTTVYGRPINFVAGNFLFRNKVFGHIITKGGCIPKAQYRNDMRTVRAMFRVLSRGGVLGIFPEATRMVDGHSIWFDSGLASVVKKSGAGLAILRTHGAYMTWPRWSRNSWRKGKITAEYVYVLSKEEAAEMTVEAGVPFQGTGRRSGKCGLPLSEVRREKRRRLPSCGSEHHALGWTRASVHFVRKPGQNG